MQLTLPDGVVNATSSPSCVVVPSRVALWYAPASTGCPAAIQLMTSATGVSVPGGAADGADGATDVTELRDGGLGAGDVGPGCDWPPVVCEHPATSSNAPMTRPPIRMAVRLSGRCRFSSQAAGASPKRADVVGFATVKACLTAMSA
jgi:hypothetical protein